MEILSTVLPLSSPLHVSRRHCSITALVHQMHSQNPSQHSVAGSQYQWIGVAV